MGVLLGVNKDTNIGNAVNDEVLTEIDSHQEIIKMDIKLMQTLQKKRKYLQVFLYVIVRMVSYIIQRQRM